MKVPYYFSFPKAVAKNIHIIPKNLMKSGSFEIKNNIFDNNINSFNNNIKRRAHSNIINQSFLDIFNNNNYENKGKNVNNRNQSSISSLLSLKQTEKDEIMKEYNIIKNKKIRTKPSNKKKIIFLSNNNYEASKKNFSTAKSKLSQKKAKYNSANISSIPINKSNNIRLKKSRLNIINNEKEPKYKINNSFINNNPFTKYEQKSDRIKSIYINKNSSISTNTLSLFHFFYLLYNLLQILCFYFRYHFLNFLFHLVYLDFHNILFLFHIFDCLKILLQILCFHFQNKQFLFHLLHHLEKFLLNLFTSKKIIYVILTVIIQKMNHILIVIHYLEL